MRHRLSQLAASLVAGTSALAALATTAAVVVGAVAGCRGEDRPAPAPTAAAPPALAHATQADLAHDLDVAAERGTWFEVRRRWQGQRLRWTVIRQRLLCASADACHVAAFPVQQAARHGWMPALELAPGQYEALAARCGEAATCEVTIEGTLAELEASDEAPTRMRFEDVRLAGERTARH